MESLAARWSTQATALANKLQLEFATQRSLRATHPISFRELRNITYSTETISSGEASWKGEKRRGAGGERT